MIMRWSKLIKVIAQWICADWHGGRAPVQSIALLILMHTAGVARRWRPPRGGPPATLAAVYTVWWGIGVHGHVHTTRRGVRGTCTVRVV